MRTSVRHLKAPRDFDEAKSIFFPAGIPASRSRVIANNTQAWWWNKDAEAHEHITIALHGLPIIRYYPDRIELSDCGWWTVTTRQRINALVPGVRLFQKNKDRYIDFGMHEMILGKMGQNNLRRLWGGSATVNYLGQPIDQR